MKISEQIDALSNVPGDIPFDRKVGKPLRDDSIDILQINVGKKCNLSCKHCHVEAGPHRTELMSREVLEKCIQPPKEPLGNGLH